jgi:hypothetical protein
MSAGKRGWRLEDRGWNSWRALALFSILYSLSSYFSAPARAATQEEFFRSMQQSVDGGGSSSTEAGRILLLIVAGAALVGLVMMLGRQKTRKVAKLRAPNNPRKLMKEISRAARVRPGEMRQLKVLADQQSCESPLTLLLCPSLLVKGIQQQGSKADRQVLLQLAKKMGLTKQK